MITFKEVSKIFHGRQVIDSLSFTVREGENFILLGTSGCGKTTTLKMINRLVTPDRGAILLNGKDIADQPVEHLRRGIGYVLQHNSLFPHYTVADNIAVVPQLLGWDKDKIRERCVQLVQKLRLPEAYLSLYPNKLSGGEAQRVNLARALAADPPLLLMDEPFSALDTITRSAIRQEFLALDELKAKTILMVTHDVHEAFELGDTICLMDQGRVLQTGSPEDLLFRPASTFVRDFLSDAYTQLLYTVVPLSALWPWLPETGEAATSNHRLSGRDTLWKAIATIRDKNDRSITISIDNGTAEKQASLDTLLAALGHYQKNR